MMLDSRNPIPLHVQLKEILRKDIAQGVYVDKIPSERELMESYRTSRTTVREAVSALVREGVIEKIHGKGTFVSLPKVNEWLGNLRSFTETIEEMGMKPGIRLLAHGVRDDNPKIARILGQERYYTIERLRYADDQPIAVERTHYPLEIGLKLANYDLTMITLYHVLEENGILLHSAEQKIMASSVSKQDAKLLGVAKNASVLAAERITTDQYGTVVEYYYSIFRADTYAFCVKMYRSPSSAK